MWISKANHTYRVAALADTFAVHFLGRDDRDLAELFGTHDRRRGRQVRAVLVGARAPTACRCSTRSRTASSVGARPCSTPGSDHVCLVLAPIEASAGDDDLLWFGEVADLDAGHAAEERQRPR